MQSMLWDGAGAREPCFVERALSILWSEDYDAAEGAGLASDSQSG